MKYFLLSACMLAALCLPAQTFTWLRGSTANGTITGVYGTQGVPSPANDPGTRHGAATWIDTQGNLWLFGGEGFSSTGTLSWLNDLWKYDRSTNEWTWVRGSNTPNAVGIYGSQTVAGATNDPGAREFAMSWTDASGNFWLFGGDGIAATPTTSAGHLNDLWKYDPTSNQWTWMKGSNTLNQNGNYGTLGVAAVTNAPGGRNWGGYWSDTNGDLWMFGGYGMAMSGTQDGYLNDLWKYSVANNQWTWVVGATAIDQNGTYGTIGVPSSGVFPGGRNFPACWNDASGNFYIMGGVGFSNLANPNIGYLNDLWRYNITANQWTWLSGSNTTNQYGTYGTQGVAGSANTPGSRYSPASWRDTLGNLWLFGGQGWATSTVGNMNDVWKYDVTANQWTWVKGSSGTNQVGTYGTMGTPAANNIPGGRHYITHWKTKKNYLWLHGGDGIDAAGTGPHKNMNDLWVFTPLCVPDNITTSAAPFCDGATATFTAHGLFPASALWYNLPTGGIAISSSSVLSVPNLSVGPHTYYVEANACTANPRATVSITVSALPSLSITATSTLLCTNFFETSTITVSGANTYTWFNTSTLTSIVYTAQPGSNPAVTVTGKDLNGCQNSKTLTTLYFAICNEIPEDGFNSYVNVYPNPSDGVLNIRSAIPLSEHHFTICNALGQAVFVRKLTESEESIHLNLPAGVYFYQLSLNGKIRGTGKLLIE